MRSDISATERQFAECRPLLRLCACTKMRSWRGYSYERAYRIVFQQSNSVAARSATALQPYAPRERRIGRRRVRGPRGEHVFRGVKSRTFFPQAPGTGSRRPGIHALRAVSGLHAPLELE